MSAFFRVACISVLASSVSAFRVRPKKMRSSGGKVVTLGDSYSSGTGIHSSGDSYEGGDCWRDHKTTPGARLAAADGRDGVNVACKGDEIPGINQQFDNLRSTNPSDFANGWAGSTILFTIGGNDLRTHGGESWPSLLQSCIVSFYGACHEEQQNQIANFDEVQEQLTQLYTKVANAASNATIRVLGYPRLMMRGWHCIPVPGLAGAAANWADDMVDELNSHLSNAVDAAKRSAPGVDIAFVDVRNYFRNGACSTSNKEVNAIVLNGLSLSDASFHPSQKGYNKYYDALGTSLGRSLPQIAVEEAEVRDTPSQMRIFHGWDANKDDKLDMNEVLAMVGENADVRIIDQMRQFFFESDKNKNNFLDAEEFDGFMDLIALGEMADPAGASLEQKAQVVSGGKVVTLGDSYSSGTGIHKSGSDYEGGDCWRDHKTTPGAKLASAMGLTGVNVACKGDEIPDIHAQFDGLRNSHAADVASGWAGSTIVFTIGGNDLRTHKGESWPGLLQSCIMSFYGACHEEQQNQIANFDEVQEELTQLYTKAAQQARNGSIRVLGYPRLMMRGWHCIPVPGLAGSAANWADKQVDELNRRLSSAVDAARARVPGVDITFVDVKSYFKNGACSSSNKEINAIVLNGLSLSDASFHPSQRGYNKYYQALGNSLGRSLPPAWAPPDVTDTDSLMHVLQGWDADKNGKLDIGEVLPMAGEDADPVHTKQLRQFFRDADKDQDDFLSFQEFDGFMELLAADELAMRGA